MPSTYTVNLGIEKPATGEQSGTWGDTTNVNFDIIDQAVNGSVRVTLVSAGTSGSPNDLNIVNGSTTSSEGRNKWIEIYSASDLGGSAYVRLVPNDAEKILFIRNSLAGSQSVLLFQGTYNASNDLEIPAGVDMVVKFDGAGASATVTDVFTKLRATEITTPTLTAGTADINGGSVDGATIGAASASTGAFTTLTASTSLNIASSTTVDGVLDEDNMASDSDTKLATQQSIKAYVDSQVGTVDTLAEILANGNTSGANNLIISSGQALTSNTINETTAGSGVTIDSVLLKDDVVNATSLEVTNLKANDGTAAGSIANSTGAVTITSFISNSVDIGGGAIDGTNIGASSEAAGTFNALTSQAATGGYLNLKTTTATGASGDDVGYIDFVSGDTSTGSTGTQARILGEYDSNGDSTALKFYTGYSTGVGSPTLVHAMSIDGKTGTKGDISFFDTSTNANFYWDASVSRLGINTTSPSVPVHIKYNGPQLRLESTASNTGIQMLTSTSFYSWFVGAQYNVSDAFEITASTAVGGTTFNDPIVTVKSSKNVGINETAPENLLHIRATTAVVSQAQLTLEGGANGYGAGIQFTSPLQTSGVNTQMAKITADGENSWDSADSNTIDSGLRFFTTVDGNINQEGMRLSAAGYLGIRTRSTPTFQLQVFQPSGETGFAVTRSTGSTFYNSPALKITNDSSKAFISSWGDMRFENVALTNATPTTKMTLDTDGNLLIGATSAPNKNATSFNLLTDGVATGQNGSYTYGVYGGSLGNLVLTANAYPANTGTDHTITFKAGSSGGGGPNTLAIFSGANKLAFGKSASIGSNTFEFRDNQSAATNLAVLNNVSGGSAGIKIGYDDTYHLRIYRPGNAANFYFDHTQTGNYYFQQNGATTVTFFQAGKVGVGTQTAQDEILTVRNTAADLLGVYRGLDVTVVGAAGGIISIGAENGSTKTPAAQLIGVLNNPATDGYFDIYTRDSSAMSFHSRFTKDKGLYVGLSSGWRGGASTFYGFKSTNPGGTTYWELQSGNTGSTGDGILFSDGATGSYGIYGYNHANDWGFIYAEGAEMLRFGNVAALDTGEIAVKPKFHAFGYMFAEGTIAAGGSATINANSAGQDGSIGIIATVTRATSVDAADSVHLATNAHGNTYNDYSTLRYVSVNSVTIVYNGSGPVITNGSAYEIKYQVRYLNLGTGEITRAGSIM